MGDLRPIGRSRDAVVLLGASLLATIPIWLPTWPPMTDLPQHAAQIALLRGMLHPGFAYESFFRVNWFTPYLLGYLLVYALVPLVGMVAACKIVVSVALASLPLTTAVVMTETGADRRWALLVIPAMYGFSYHWGLLNFLVAAPFGLLSVWLALRHARRPTTAGAMALGVAINILFFCHAMICVFFALVSAGILLSGARQWTAIRRMLPVVSVLPLMIVWGGLTVATPVASRPTMWDLGWFTTDDAYYTSLARWTTPGISPWGWGRTSGILPRLLGAQPGLFSTLVGLSLFLLPIAAGARFTRRLTIWIPFIVCLGTLLVAPARLYGIDFTFQRFTVFALPLYLITVQQPPGRSWRWWTWPSCALLAAGWIGVVSGNAIRYEADAGGFAEILQQMVPSQRALSITFDRDSDAAIAPPFLHFPAWYSAMKGGMVDPNFAGTHVQLVLYRPSAVRLEQFEWDPGRFNWKSFGGERYRYFVVRAPDDRSEAIFRNATCSVRLVHRVNYWWLYEKDPGCAAGPP